MKFIHKLKIDVDLDFRILLSCASTARIRFLVVFILFALVS